MVARKINLSRTNYSKWSKLSSARNEIPGSEDQPPKSWEIEGHFYLSKFLFCFSILKAIIFPGSSDDITREYVERFRAKQHGFLQWQSFTVQSWHCASSLRQFRGNEWLGTSFSWNLISKDDEISIKPIATRRMQKMAVPRCSLDKTEVSGAEIRMEGIDESKYRSDARKLLQARSEIVLMWGKKVVDVGNTWQRVCKHR